MRSRICILARYFPSILQLEKLTHFAPPKFSSGYAGSGLRLIAYNTRRIKPVFLNPLPYWKNKLLATTRRASGASSLHSSPDQVPHIYYLSDYIVLCTIPH